MENSFFYYNPDSHNQHAQFLPHPNATCQQGSTPVSSGMDSSVPFPSTLMSNKAQIHVNSKPTLHVPTPIMGSQNFSLDALKKSNGMLTPNSPTMMPLDAADLFFVPPTPTLSVASSASSPPLSCGMLTPNESWSMDDKACSGTITPLELHLSAPSGLGGEWSPPMTPSYLCPPSFMRSQSNPSILLSAANCPSLSPSSEHGSSSDLDFCDPRNLTYPTPSPAPQFDFTADNIPDIKCEKDFSGVFALGELSDSDDEFCFDLSQPQQQLNTTSLSMLQKSIECEDEVEDFDEIESVFSDNYLSLPSPPNSQTSRQSSITPSRPTYRGRTPKKLKLEFDSDVELDELIMHARANGVPESAIDSNGFLTPYPTSHSSLTPTPTEFSSCESNNESSPDPSAARQPVVRRGRKQSLTDDPSKTFVCHIPACGRRFRRQEHLKRHFRSLHTREKPFSCPECGKKFSRSDNLSQHTRIHGSGAIVMDLVEEGDILHSELMRGPDGEMLGRMLLDPEEVASQLKEKLAGDKKNMRRKRKRDSSVGEEEL